jgi:hypothetical protein
MHQVGDQTRFILRCTVKQSSRLLVSVCDCLFTVSVGHGGIIEMLNSDGRAVSWSRWLLRQFNSVTIRSYLLDSIGLSARRTAAGSTAHAHTSCLCHTFEVPNSIILFFCKVNNFLLKLHRRLCCQHTAWRPNRENDEIWAGSDVTVQPVCQAQCLPSIGAAQSYTLRHCPSEADGRSVGHQIPRLFMELGSLIGLPSLQELPMELIVSQLNSSYRAYIPQPGWRNRTNPWQ